MGLLAHLKEEYSVQAKTSAQGCVRVRYRYGSHVVLGDARTLPKSGLGDGDGG
jgi:hypothetical protein